MHWKFGERIPYCEDKKILGEIHGYLDIANQMKYLDKTKTYQEIVEMIKKQSIPEYYKVSENLITDYVIRVDKLDEMFKVESPEIQCPICFQLEEIPEMHIREGIRLYRQEYNIQIEKVKNRGFIPIYRCKNIAIFTDAGYMKIGNIEYASIGIIDMFNCVQRSHEITLTAIAKERKVKLNNVVGELIAIKKAIEYIERKYIGIGGKAISDKGIQVQHFDQITIYTDSLISVEIMEKWIYRWTKEEESMNNDNAYLLVEIHQKLLQYQQIKLEHVRGHQRNGNWKTIGNHYADRAATYSITHMWLAPRCKMTIPEIEDDGNNSAICQTCLKNKWKPADKETRIQMKQQMKKDANPAKQQMEINGVLKQYINSNFQTHGKVDWVNEVEIGRQKVWQGKSYKFYRFFQEEVIYRKALIKTMQQQMQLQEDSEQRETQDKERQRQKFIRFQQASIGDTTKQDTHLDEYPFDEKDIKEGAITEQEKVQKQWLSRQLYDLYKNKDEKGKLDMIENLALQDKVDIATISIRRIVLKTNDKDMSKSIQFEDILRHNLEKEYEEILQRRGTRQFIRKRMKKLNIIGDFDKKQPGNYFKIEKIKTLDWDRIANQGTKFQFSILTQDKQERQIAVKNIQWNADNELTQKFRKEYYRIMPTIWKGLMKAQGFYGNGSGKGIYECQICKTMRGQKGIRASIQHLYNCVEDLVENVEARTQNYLQLLQDRGYQKDVATKRCEKFKKEEEQWINIIEPDYESIYEVAITYGLIRKYTIDSSKIKHLASTVQMTSKIIGLYKNLNRDRDQIVKKLTWEECEEANKGQVQWKKKWKPTTVETEKLVRVIKVKENSEELRAPIPTEAADRRGIISEPESRKLKQVEELKALEEEVFFQENSNDIIEQDFLVLHDNSVERNIRQNGEMPGLVDISVVLPQKIQKPSQTQETRIHTQEQIQIMNEYRNQELEDLVMNYDLTDQEEPIPRSALVVQVRGIKVQQLPQNVETTMEDIREEFCQSRKETANLIQEALWNQRIEKRDGFKKQKKERMNKFKKVEIKKFENPKIIGDYILNIEKESRKLEKLTKIKEKKIDKARESLRKQYVLENVQQQELMVVDENPMNSMKMQSIRQVSEQKRVFQTEIINPIRQEQESMQYKNAKKNVGREKKMQQIEKQEKEKMRKQTQQYFDQSYAMVKMRLYKSTSIGSKVLKSFPDSIYGNLKDELKNTLKLFKFKEIKRDKQNKEFKVTNKFLEIIEQKNKEGDWFIDEENNLEAIEYEKVVKQVILAEQVVQQEKSPEKPYKTVQHTTKSQLLGKSTVPRKNMERGKYVITKQDEKILEQNGINIPKPIPFSHIQIPKGASEIEVARIVQDNQNRKLTYDEAIIERNLKLFDELIKIQNAFALPVNQINNQTKQERCLVNAINDNKKKDKHRKLVRLLPKNFDKYDQERIKLKQEMPVTKRGLKMLENKKNLNTLNPEDTTTMRQTDDIMSDSNEEGGIQDSKRKRLKKQ
ncbi:UNKNOWN [Stylonychia lemnae]|uniref:RNase H type-1 domain-containing protein n=1 Tax=Stylonychia lemnae TaxID=5949 RepID=A0A078B8N3_STYLE|nr:UNKNOWN [Stylonychia lemnae]|eukprot:CDW90571.1 UNKNOWN [Stylonychia lemnae]